MRYAIINTETNTVENIIEYEDAPETPIPGFEENYMAVPDELSSPGWLYQNGEFTNPNPPPPPITAPPQPTLQQLQTQLTDLQTQIAAAIAAQSS